MLNLKLDNVIDVTPRIRAFQFSAADGSALPKYEAGAHVEFDLGTAGLRAYSLIDWPTENDAYCVAVQREDGGQGGSQAMHKLAVGSEIAATLPSNDFPLQDGAAPVLLLAGGIGITPMISMASTLHASGRAFALHFTARSAGVMGFADQLTQAFADHVTLHLDDAVPLDLTTLMEAQTKETQLYICGPKGMIEAARVAAQNAGITDIHIELFAAPEASGEDTPFEVEIQDSGQVFTIPVGKTIVEVLEEEGVDVMFDCQRGDCGICQTDVISGIPDHRDVVLSEDERAAGKVMQICVSRAKSPRLLLDI